VIPLTKKNTQGKLFEQRFFRNTGPAGKAGSAVRGKTAEEKEPPLGGE
jgi:hypothetical protein